MSGLYIKLQVGYYRDAKFLRAGPMATELYLRGCCFAMENLTDGIILEVQLPLLTIGLEDVPVLVAKLTEQPPDGSRPLWSQKGGGWRISAFLDHCKSAQQIEAEREDKRRAGLASAAARHRPGNTPSTVCQQPVDTSFEQTVNTPGSGSGGTASTAVLHPHAHVEGEPGNGSESPLEDVPDDSPYQPDDPQYKLDLNWHAAKELDTWARKLGAFPGDQRLRAQYVLERLHRYHMLSIRQIRALIAHVIEDQDARGWWGTGKSPATWLDNRTGTEPTWLKIRAHAIKAGAYPTGTAAVVAGPDLGPDPGVDPNCDCRRGWVTNEKTGADGFCARCKRGKWLKAGGRDK